MSSKGVIHRHTKKKALRNYKNFLSRQGYIESWIEKLEKKVKK